MAELRGLKDSLALTGGFISFNVLALRIGGAASTSRENMFGNQRNSVTSGLLIPVAEKWFTLQQAEILTGNESLGGRTVATVSKAALKNLESE